MAGQQPPDSPPARPSAAGREPGTTPTGRRAEPARPLAERMRPRTLDEVSGQEHLLGAGAPLRVLLEAGNVPSMVFWGPPGVGKTTLARLLAQFSDAEFLTLSAVLARSEEQTTELQSLMRISYAVFCLKKK